ncbi:MAG: response regulator [Haliangiales bacterium]
MVLITQDAYTAGRNLMPQEPSDSNREVVLIVDDEPANVAALFEYLDARGYRVLIAEQGAEAVTRAEQVQPCVILLDVSMPDVDGLEVCRRLKANPATSKVPVVFMSARTTVDDKLAGFAVGAVDYVTKPFQHEEVLARVRAHAAVFRLEAALRAKNQELEHEVTQRRRAEAALATHVRILKAQNAELDSFARTVAHNLKAPLTGLIGFADLLAEEDALQGDAQRYLEAIQLSGQRMNDITEGLLLLARLRAAEVEVKPLDMAAIIARSQRRLAPMFASQPAEVIIAPEWPTALGHAPWIEEVWVNFLSNALKHGGRPARIELGATPRDDGHIRHWVRDNGPGVAPETRALLFSEFTRLSQANTAGYGLGLSIVKRIVDKLRGRVGVDSDLGQGSRFYFDLPAA